MAIGEMVSKAEQMGVDYQCIQLGQGGSMLIVSASGTAVKLKRVTHCGQPQPPVEWFARGIIDREKKLSGYLLSSTHPDRKNKLRLWRGVFGIDEGDANL